MAATEKTLPTALLSKRGGGYVVEDASIMRALDLEPASLLPPALGSLLETRKQAAEVMMLTCLHTVGLMKAMLKQIGGKLAVGIIGGGHMGRLLAARLLRSGVPGSQLRISTRRPETLRQLRKSGVECSSNNAALRRWANILFIACLPSQAKDVARSMRDVAAAEATAPLIVSLMCAVKRSRVSQLFRAPHALLASVHMPTLLAWTSARAGAGADDSRELPALVAYCMARSCSDVSAVLAHLAALHSVGMRLRSWHTSAVAAVLSALHLEDPRDVRAAGGELNNAHRWCRRMQREEVHVKLRAKEEEVPPATLVPADTTAECFAAFEEDETLRLLAVHHFRRHFCFLVMGEAWQSAGDLLDSSGRPLTAAGEGVGYGGKEAEAESMEAGEGGDSGDADGRKAVGSEGKREDASDGRDSTPVKRRRKRK
eukprot:PLAT6960.1.p1 GENE.PLAT6960.1~~PLAT6960.1.p1  ORF type:complete len:428 (+),score=163.46 PLAT6960.1:86-1369(+)